MLAEGDLVWVDFDPVRGSEQAGKRPAVVVSATRLHEESQRAIVCPITRNTSPWPTKVMLPDNLPIAGAVLTDQLRSVDRKSRGFRNVGQVPDETLVAIRSRIGVLLGILAP